MKSINESEGQIAEAAARVISTTAHAVVRREDLPLTTQTITLVANAYLELRDQIRALHDLVDLTDPNDPIGIALTKVGLRHRPVAPLQSEPRLVYVRTAEQIDALSVEELLALYCHVMRDVPTVFVKYEIYIVRVWDGMDGCWTDCTGNVSCEEALRYWAKRTDGGARHVAYAEIDYYRIFPGGTRMDWDGSEGREMHR